MRKFRKALIISALLVLTLLALSSIPERRNELNTQHFTLQYSSSIDSMAIAKLANTLENSYSRIGNDLKTQPYHPIETNIYAQRWRYIKATGNWGASGSIEGISKLHFVELAWGESDVNKTAVHEFAHAVTLKLLLDQETQPVDSKTFDKKFMSFPVWLWEAISVYEAKQFVDPRTLPYLNHGQYPSLSELNNRTKGGKIYSCGYTIVEYILDRYGQDSFVDLIKNYGNLKKAFGVTDEQFSKDWYGFVREKYLK